MDEIGIENLSGYPITLCDEKETGSDMVALSGFPSISGNQARWQKIPVTMVQKCYVMATLAPMKGCVEQLSSQVSKTNIEVSLTMDEKMVKMEGLTNTLAQESKGLLKILVADIVKLGLCLIAYVPTTDETDTIDLLDTNTLSSVVTVKNSDPKAVRITKGTDVFGKFATQMQENPPYKIMRIDPSSVQLYVALGSADQEPMFQVVDNQSQQVMTNVRVIAPSSLHRRTGKAFSLASDLICCWTDIYELRKLESWNREHMKDNSLPYMAVEIRSDNKGPSSGVVLSAAHGGIPIEAVDLAAAKSEYGNEVNRNGIENHTQQIAAAAQFHTWMQQNVKNGFFVPPYYGFENRPMHMPSWAKSVPFFGPVDATIKQLTNPPPPPQMEATIKRLQDCICSNMGVNKSAVIEPESLGQSSHKQMQDYGAGITAEQQVKIQEYVRTIITHIAFDIYRHRITKLLKEAGVSKAKETQERIRQAEEEEEEEEDESNSISDNEFDDNFNDGTADNNARGNIFDRHSIPSAFQILTSTGDYKKLGLPMDPYNLNTDTRSHGREMVKRKSSPLDKEEDEDHGKKKTKKQKITGTKKQKRKEDGGGGGGDREYRSMSENNKRFMEMESGYGILHINRNSNQFLGMAGIALEAMPRPTMGMGMITQPGRTNDKKSGHRHPYDQQQGYNLFDGYGGGGGGEGVNGDDEDETTPGYWINRLKNFSLSIHIKGNMNVDQREELIALYALTKGEPGCLDGHELLNMIAPSVGIAEDQILMDLKKRYKAELAEREANKVMMLENQQQMAQQQPGGIPSGDPTTAVETKNSNPEVSLTQTSTTLPKPSSSTVAKGASETSSNSGGGGGKNGTPPKTQTKRQSIEDQIRALQQQLAQEGDGDSPAVTKKSSSSSSSKKTPPKETKDHEDGDEEEEEKVVKKKTKKDESKVKEDKKEERKDVVAVKKKDAAKTKKDEDKVGTDKKNERKDKEEKSEDEDEDKSGSESESESKSKSKSKTQPKGKKKEQTASDNEEEDSSDSEEEETKETKKTTKKGEEKKVKPPARVTRSSDKKTK